MAEARRPKDVCRGCWADFMSVQFPMPTPKWRPAPHPGPRCATHWRIERDRRKKASHDKRVQQVYGLEPGEYASLYKFQGGRCWICQRATGKTRRLSVDHDHDTGNVRGLLCRPCNDMLGHARDVIGFFYRAATYLANPPYFLMKQEQEAEDGLQSLQPEREHGSEG